MASLDDSLITNTCGTENVSRQTSLSSLDSIVFYNSSFFPRELESTSRHPG